MIRSLLIAFVLLFATPALAEGVQGCCSGYEGVKACLPDGTLVCNKDDTPSPSCGCDMVKAEKPEATPSKESEADSCTDNQDIYYGTHEQCLDEYKGSEDKSEYCRCLIPSDAPKASEPEKPEKCRAICRYDDVNECQKSGHSYKYCKCINYAENDHCQASN